MWQSSSRYGTMTVLQPKDGKLGDELDENHIVPSESERSTSGQILSNTL